MTVDRLEDPEDSYDCAEDLLKTDCQDFERVVIVSKLSLGTEVPEISVGYSDSPEKVFVLSTPRSPLCRWLFRVWTTRRSGRRSYQRSQRLDVVGVFVGGRVWSGRRPRTRTRPSGHVGHLSPY